MKWFVGILISLNGCAARLSNWANFDNYFWFTAHSKWLNGFSGKNFPLILSKNTRWRNERSQFLHTWPVCNQLAVRICIVNVINYEDSSVRPSHKKTNKLNECRRKIVNIHKNWIKFDWINDDFARAHTHTQCGDNGQPHFNVTTKNASIVSFVQNAKHKVNISRWQKL